VALGLVPQTPGFYTGMGPNKILVSLQGMVPTLSGPYCCHYSLTCVWALHFKLTCQVCFLWPRIRQTTDASDGDENDAVPLITPLLVCPDTVGPFIALCQQKAFTE
jgi:hypothetical protein